MLSLFQVNANCNGSYWRAKNPYYLRKLKPALIRRIKEVLLVGKTFGTIERDFFLFIYLFIYLLTLTITAILQSIAINIY